MTAAHTLYPATGVRHVVVPMAASRVSRDRAEMLVTYALGSCLGITIWDPVCHVGGLLHVMLPDSSTSAEKADANPDMFIDKGVPRLFKEAYALGAEKKRLVVCVAGGATLGKLADSSFQIGQRNITMLRKILWKNGVLIKGQDVGGNFPRTLALNIDTGEVLLKTDEGVTRLNQEA
jgi:chemotaxis protein CheD